MKTFTTKITTIDGAAAVLLTPEILEAWGAQIGAIHEISVEGKRLIVRLLSANEFDEMVDSTTEEVFGRRRSAYEKLAEGVQ